VPFGLFGGRFRILTNAQVTGAIMAQAVAGALPAHLVAGVLLYIAGRTIGGMGIHLSMSFSEYCWAVFLTVGVCVMASLLSVWKVMSVEPAEVFKG